MRARDRLEHLRERPHVAGLEEDAPDGHPLPPEVGFSEDARAVGQLGAEPHGVEGRGQDGSAHGEHLAGDPNRVEEVPRDVGEGGEEEVSEAVAREMPLAREPELEQLRHQGLDVRQGDEAVSDVARGKHLELLAQAPGAAPVVGHGDHGRQVGDAPAEVALQGGEDHGETRAAADRDDPPPAVQTPARCHVWILAHAGPRARGPLRRAEPRQERGEGRRGRRLEAVPRPGDGMAESEDRRMERLAAEPGHVRPRARGRAAAVPRRR